MYLHVGQDVLIREKGIIGIFDLEKASVDKDTRLFLKTATDRGEVDTVSTELPKSFIVWSQGTGQTVYISQLSTATLEKRRGIPGETKMGKK